MDHRPLTLNQQDSTTNQIPKFEFILTSSILAEWLNSHDLTPQQIISGRFYPKNSKLSLDLIQKSFPKDVPESSKNTLEEMIKLIKEWPRKLDKSNLTVYIREVA